MIFNCLNCGVAISSKKENCPHCRVNNQQSLQYLTGQAKRNEYIAWKERIKGSILSYVTR